MATEEGIKTPIEPGLIARVAAGARYALTGKRPEWFGPGETLAPVAQEEAKGREFDFPFAINTRYTPRQGEAISFAELRALADSCDVLRLVIETRKDQIERLKWAVAPVDKKAQPDKRCEDLTAFFRMPDRHHSWSQWVRMLLEDLFVIDAPTIYIRQTKGGQFYAAEQIDGATIKRVLDDTGRTPIPPAPAYQQVLKGMPAVDYTAAELLYLPRNPRVHKIYGFSPVEQIITTVNIALRRTIHQLQYYTEGNIPEALIGVPQTWNPDQIKQFQMYWDSLLEGNTAQRRHAKFVPGDLKIQMTKEAVLKDGFDEWLARIVCFCFSISPQPFVAQVNRATAETAAEESKLEGLEPIKNWVKNTVDAILLKGFGVTDLEFTWTDEKEIDPKAKAEIDKIYVEAKVLTPDEVRADLGRDPLTPEQKEELTPAPPPMLEQQQPPGAAGNEPPPEPGKEALGKAKKSLAPIDRERPAIVRIQNKLEKVVRAFLAAQGKEIAAHITDEFGKMSADDASRMARIIEDLEFDGWAVLAEDMVSLLQAVMTTGAFDALAQVGIKDAGKELVTLVNDQAVAYAKDRAAELVGMKWIDGELVPNPKAEWAITESTREMIRADVVRAMEEGLSNDDLADLIESNYAFSPERAEVIARTETAFADVEGNLTAYRESGLVESKQWIVGAGCCDLCQTLDKKIVPLNEPFPKGKQGPPLHPNCRCDLLPVLSDDDD